MEPDTLDGHAVERVSATTPDSVRETLYFNHLSGLLDGWDVTIAGTQLATRLQDYRRVDGIRIPFRVVRRRPGFTWTEQAAEILQNVPIDSALFVKRP